MAQLTIVIPVYNRAEVVGRTLRSIEAQTLRPLSVVLVDNGSADRSVEVLRAWKERVEASDFKVEILSETKPGACAARNTGLKAVQTEWTIFFDSDDVMLPNHAARAMEAAEHNPKADVIGWNTQIIYADGSKRTLKFHTTDKLYNNIFHSSFATQRYFARTELFRRVGAWLEGAKLMDDSELGNRILLTNPQVVRIGGEPTVEVFESQESISNEADGRIDNISVALDSIRQTLPADKKHWADLQFLIKASTWAGGDPKAPAAVAEILSRQPRLRRRLWQALYRYSLRGGRGVARIYRFFSYLGI